MIKKILPLAFLAITVIMVKAQRPSIELAFTAIDSAAYVQLDSIKVMNHTQGGDTVLYYPDTVLSLYYIGIPDINETEGAFRVLQNYPNPVMDQTTISFYVPEKDEVSIIVTDILGRVIQKSDRVLNKGTHSFRFVPARGNLYFFTAQWRGNSSSIKILQAFSNSNKTSTIEYIGIEDLSPQLKATEDIQSFLFNLGDELLYIGNANGHQSRMLDAPDTSQTYTFQFATNIPCPGTPTVNYEGQVYNTIQIFSQCWLKENLNVGTMIPGTQEMEDDGIIEKYCYKNEPDSCTKYGGLYQWNEMMQYTTQQGTQGMCPPGWHLPTDEEWKVMEGVVDSQYGIGDPEWDIYGEFRGYDAGTNLKTTSGWNYGGNGTNSFGFSGLPGGHRGGGSICDFNYIGDEGFWRTSSVYDDYNAWFRHLDYSSPGVWRYGSRKTHGFSVRCLRD